MVISLVEAQGYILRIASEEWLDEVFNLATYYTSVRRKWTTDQTVLFVHKTAIGDAFVGYGVIKDVHEKEDLTEEERNRCEEHGWRKAIEFAYVIRFEEPLLVKNTFLKNLKVVGRCLNGYPLNEEMLRAMITQSEDL